ncbi:MAG TPA: hypothetical protein V6D17_07005 [Candidatus Obscuribacterales bacterium]
MDAIQRAVLISSFVAIISGMGICSLLNSPPDFLWDELRRPTAFPAWNVKTFPKQFDGFFNDRIALRSELVMVRNWLKLQAFNSSGTSLVMAGKDGWLYLKDDVCQGLPYCTRPFTNEELNLIADHYSETRAWLRKQGIAYLVVVVPGKSAIYPEFLPAGLNLVWSRNRVSQVLEALGKRDVPVVDLYNAERKRSKHEQIFFKGDSHWNDRGALLAALTIEDAVRKRFGAACRVRAGRTSVFPSQLDSPDLLRMLGLGAIAKENYERIALTSEGVIECRMRTSGSATCHATIAASLETAIASLNDRDPVLTVSSGKELPRAIFLCDSFATSLRPLIAPDFKEALWCREAEVPRKLVAAMKPDIVIEEIADRFVSFRLPPAVRDKLAARNKLVM